MMLGPQKTLGQLGSSHERVLIEAFSVSATVFCCPGSGVMKYGPLPMSTLTTPATRSQLFLRSLGRKQREEEWTANC